MLDVLHQGKVQGALLEINEASNMQNAIAEKGLKISKLIKSGSGFGIVLTGKLEGLHPEIRSYLKNNNEMIRRLLANYTKPTVVSDFCCVGLFLFLCTKFKYYALINRALGPYEKIFVLMFMAYGLNAVTSMWHERPNKYF